MAFQYHIDKSHALCYVVLYGKVDGFQIEQALASIMNHPEWRTGYNTLWDGTSIEETEFHLKGLGRIHRTARRYNQQVGAGKSAYVARREVDVLAARLLKASIRFPGRETRVFTNLDEAREWVGLSRRPAAENDPPVIEG